MNEKALTISKETVAVLKNYSTINPSLFFTEGKLGTVSVGHNLMAYADVVEKWPVEFAIYDLGQFLNILGCFNTPLLTFHEHYLTVNETDESKSNTRVKYVYTEPTNIISPKEPIKMPKGEDISFELKKEVLAELLHLSAILGVEHLVVENSGIDIVASVRDAGGATDNSMTMIVGKSNGDDYKFVSKIEYWKLIPGNYQVVMSSKKIAHMKNTASDIEYWLALDPKHCEYSVKEKEGVKAAKQ